MTFDDCVSALIVVAESRISVKEALEQTERIVTEYFYSSNLSNSVAERQWLAKTLGDKAPDPLLTLIGPMQAYLAGVAA